MKLAVVGTRHKLSPDRLGIVIARIMATEPTDILVTGCCPTGVDEAVRNWATYHRTLVVFHAAWRLLDRAAGPVRNSALADYADACVAYPAAQSRGTRHCIEAFRALGKHVDVYLPGDTVATMAESGGDR